MEQAQCTGTGAAGANSPGYGGKPQNPMYTTTANSYGSKAPSIYTVPTQFFARSQKFSGHLGVCGMYRNYSLNTEVDKSQI
ncbi:hypothetical protein ACOMHN_018661 [Nucella lapillus]